MSNLIDCRRYEGHAICACCKLGGCVSGCLDSRIAISEKGMVSLCIPFRRVLLNVVQFMHFSELFKIKIMLETEFCSFSGSCKVIATSVEYI